jgi:hypothetical protein
MHAPSSMSTAPVRGSREMASAGQCRRHGASRQWLQAMERWNTGTPGARPALWVITCRHEVPGANPFSLAHATAHA